MYPIRVVLIGLTLASVFALPVFADDQADEVLRANSGSIRYGKRMDNGDTCGFRVNPVNLGFHFAFTPTGTKSLNQDLSPILASDLKKRFMRKQLIKASRPGLLERLIGGRIDTDFVISYDSTNRITSMAISAAGQDVLEGCQF